MYVVKVVSIRAKLVEVMKDLRLTSAKPVVYLGPILSYLRTQICIPDSSTNRIYSLTELPHSTNQKAFQVWAFIFYTFMHTQRLSVLMVRRAIYLPSAMCCCSTPVWEQTIDQMTQGGEKKQGREGSHDCRRCCLRKHNSATRHIFTVVTSSCALFLDLRKQKDDTTS